MKWSVLFLLCAITVPVDGSLRDRAYLTRAACERNPNLSICKKQEEEIPLIEPPSLPPSERQHEQGGPSRAQRERDDLSELNEQISHEYRKEKEGRSFEGGEETLRSKCIRMAPVAQKHCEKSTLTKDNVGRCVAYFKDCYRFLGKADPLYSIANAFSSAVNLNFANVDVNGIPYYPINEEGSVGVGVGAHIPFGSWGGGYSDHVGVRDYWSQHQEVGANWYEGKYGYKNGWSVPLVQSLGIEGGQHNTVSVPLNQKDLGKIMVDNGYGVGGYYGHNDHVGVDWRKGDVLHNFGVSSPFVGAGFNTGQAVTFPSLDTFMNAGKK
ncbi:hypothetical protein Y032_0639g988 [Ancylostoma ceylanicum]|uniref:Uncharacterized protein n=1 Tax=Ancylostoma ceylanicum TaxID=53326 RepID=A0A016WLB0_9BILA|nr:hypothetical protein Y032_0639g988 [Ancylostoma ceylanicum]